MTKSHLTKKWLTGLAAIASSVFLLAACETQDDQQTIGEQPGTTTQDGAATYGQRDRDAGIGAEQDPAMRHDPAMDRQPGTTWEDGSATGTGTGTADDTTQY